LLKVSELYFQVIRLISKLLENVEVHMNVDDRVEGNGSRKREGGTEHLYKNFQQSTRAFSVLRCILTGETKLHMSRI
jgi:hypothetical protein